MLSFVEHRKNRIRKNLGDQTFFRGVDHVVEVLNLSLKQALEVDVPLTEDIFQKRKLNQLLREDYKTGRHYVQELVALLKDHLSVAIVNEAGTAAASGDPLDAIKQEISDKIDEFIEKVKAEVGNSLTGRATPQQGVPNQSGKPGQRQRGPSMGTPVATSQPPVDNSDDGSNPFASMQGGTPQNGRHRSAASQGGSSGGGYSGAATDREKSAAGKRKGPGFWGGLGNLWKNMVWRPLKRAWYDEAVVEMAIPLIEASNTAIEDAIDQFGTELKAFVLGKIPEIVAIYDGTAAAGTPTDPTDPTKPIDPTGSNGGAAKGPFDTLPAGSDLGAQARQQANAASAAGGEDVVDQGTVDQAAAETGDVETGDVETGDDNVFNRPHASFTFGTHMKRLRKELEQHVEGLADVGHTKAKDYTGSLLKAILQHLNVTYPSSYRKPNTLIRYLGNRADNFIIRTNDEKQSTGRFRYENEGWANKRDYITQLAHHLIVQGESLPQAIQSTEKEVAKDVGVDPNEVGAGQGAQVADQVSGGGGEQKAGGTMSPEDIAAAKEAGLTPKEYLAQKQTATSQPPTNPVRDDTVSASNPPTNGLTPESQAQELANHLKSQHPNEFAAMVKDKYGTEENPEATFVQRAATAIQGGKSLDELKEKQSAYLVNKYGSGEEAAPVPGASEKSAGEETGGATEGWDANSVTKQATQDIQQIIDHFGLDVAVPQLKLRAAVGKFVRDGGTPENYGEFMMGFARTIPAIAKALDDDGGDDGGGGGGEEATEEPQSQGGSSDSSNPFDSELDFNARSQRKDDGGEEPGHMVTDDEGNPVGYISDPTKLGDEDEEDEGDEETAEPEVRPSSNLSDDERDFIRRATGNVGGEQEMDDVKEPEEIERIRKAQEEGEDYQRRSKSKEDASTRAGMKMTTSGMTGWEPGSKDTTGNVNKATNEIFKKISGKDEYAELMEMLKKVGYDGPTARNTIKELLKNVIKDNWNDYWFNGAPMDEDEALNIVRTQLNLDDEDLSAFGDEGEMGDENGYNPEEDDSEDSASERGGEVDMDELLGGDEDEEDDDYEESAKKLSSIRQKMFTE